MFPVASPFRLRVSHHLDRATFPVPATSNATCGFHVDDVRLKVDRARCESLVKKEVVNRVSDAVLEVLLPADSAMAFDDLGDCDSNSNICGGVFSVKSEYRPNLEFEHAIRPAPAFLPSA